MSDAVIAVLVVEDDQIIQAMVEEALADGGFQATITSSAEQAITLLQDDNSQFRAVVTDIKLAGKDVARAARETDPAMPVIYITSSDGADWASKGVPNSVLLAKPFALAQLVTAISQLLNANPPAAAVE